MDKADSYPNQGGGLKDCQKYPGCDVLLMAVSQGQILRTLSFSKAGISTVLEVSFLIKVFTLFRSFTFKNLVNSLLGN